MKNRIVFAILIAITVCIFVGLAIIKYPQVEVSLPNKDKILVTTSFYPLADFAQKIGLEKVSVINITPVGSEPHDYEPSPHDLASIYNSKVFIYNGAGLEGWVDKIIPDLSNRGVAVVKASDGIEIYGTTTQIDPHFWLDPVFAQKMVINIRNGLQTADSQNSDFYQKNSDDLIVKLVALDQSYQRNLYNCQQKDVITSHNTLGYLSRRYKFQTFSVSGLSPDEEPSPQKMAELANLVRQIKVKYILTEPLISSKLADTLASEVNISTLIFNPLEGLTEKETNSGEDYFSIQEKNINSLSTALECPKI